MTAPRATAVQPAIDSPWFVAIGASGPEGLADIQHVLAALPAALPGVVLVVLHRSWTGTTHLCELLARRSALPVRIATNGEMLRAGTVYIGRPAAHLTVAAQSYAQIIDDPVRTHGNRTIDLLFKSVAAKSGKRFIGVVLSGSLDDGSRGLEAIHAAGGKTMVITLSGVAGDVGMPENAVAYDGPIDVIGSATAIAAAILGLVMVPDTPWFTP